MFFCACTTLHYGKKHIKLRVWYIISDSGPHSFVESFIQLHCTEEKCEDVIVGNKPI